MLESDAGSSMVEDHLSYVSLNFHFFRFQSKASKCNGVSILKDRSASVKKQLENPIGGFSFFVINLGMSLYVNVSNSILSQHLVYGTYKIGKIYITVNITFV